MDELRKKMFKCAMNGRWKEVIGMYDEDERVHEARITRSGDTALHIAVSQGREVVVECMVSLVSTSALQIQNERKNTVLHIAASMGNVKMCLLIANKHPFLVDVRNVDGETPLFSAALHGRKQAFLCLHFIRNSSSLSSPYYANCTRNNGDTILHCAIDGKHFDLAFRIINLYEQLVNWVNEQGLSPLHLLAAKPSVFRSGSSLGLFQMIIYHCISVQELQVAQFDQDKFTRPSNAKPIQQGRPQLPHNYKTCWHLFNVINTALLVVTNKFSIRRGDHGQSSNVADVEVGGDHTRNAREDARSKARARRHLLYPPNYKACCNFFKFVYVAVMAILGWNELRKIQRKKEHHTWSVQIMNELLCRALLYEYDDDGSIPLASHISFQEDTGPAPYCIDLAGNISRTPTAPLKNQDSKKKKKIETPILIAAKNGITEIVEKILEVFPEAIHDENKEEKNIVLLAAENRQPYVYLLLLKSNLFIESLFRQVDHKGNSALHLAPKLAKPCLSPALQIPMGSQVFVLNSMPLKFFVRYNKEKKTPIEVFDETHKDLVESGSDWLNNTSQSCSVVAALIATVAFATTSAVPGGVQEKTGHPTLEGETAFTVYAVSSLISVFGSVISVLMFLSLLTSRHQWQDFRKKLPVKLILALTSMIVSLASMLVSFCTAHFFMVQDRLPNVALPLYFVASLPLIVFAYNYLPLYCDFWRATLTSLPQGRGEVEVRRMERERARERNRNQTSVHDS